MKILTTIALILLCLSAKAQSFSDYESYCLKQKMDSIENAKHNYHYVIFHPIMKTKTSQDIIWKKYDVPKKKRKVYIGQPLNTTLPIHGIPLFYFNIR